MPRTHSLEGLDLSLVVVKLGRLAMRARSPTLTGRLMDYAFGDGVWGSWTALHLP